MASGVEQDDLSGHFAFGALADPHPDPLALTQFSDVAAPQRLHMNEDVWRAGPARDKAIALRAVEPFHHALKRRPARLGDIAGRMLGRLRHGAGGGIIQRDQLYRPPSAGAP